MLIKVKKNKKNKSIWLVRGLFVSISTIMLTACANNVKNVASTAPIKADNVEVKAYSVIPVAKPAYGYQNSTAIAKNKSDEARNSPKPVAYLSASERAYKKVGRASWYGAAFNGHLTANGEIYDMHNLTAAHPTMPLPSYARVTNLENGASIIVRVNDRGPFAADRVIDLSKQAATLLDYKDDGLADVKVEYVGRAPIEGNDNEFLMASYKPGNITTDTLLAMAGVNFKSSFTEKSGNNIDSNISSELPDQAVMGGNFPVLPEIGPLPAFKPDNAQLLAFAGENGQKSNGDVFDSVLNISATKTEKNNHSSLEKSSSKDNMKLASQASYGNRQSFTSATKKVLTGGKNSSTKTNDALEIAWAEEVSKAFAYGSKQ